MNKMKSERKVRWYNLPEEVREKLIKLSAGFYTLKDQGKWVYPPLVGYEPEVIAVLRTRNSLSYDIFIPTIVKMMKDGVLTAVFPIGMMVVDVVFYQFDESKLSHHNAYQRAGLGSIIGELEKKK